MTTGNKIIQVSGAQFHNILSVLCIVCSPPQVKSPSITVYPLYTPLPLPSTHDDRATAVAVHELLLFCFFFAQSLYAPAQALTPHTLTVSACSLSLSLLYLLVHF